MESLRIHLAVSALFRVVLDACFPRACVECGLEGALLCTPCTSNLNPPESLWKPPALPDNIDGAWAVFPYGNPLIRQLLGAWKYNGDHSAWEHLRPAYLAASQRDIPWFEIDAIVFIPVSKKKSADRGFNQARILAEAIASHHHRPILGVITRSGGKTQAQQSKEDRGAIKKKNPFSSKGKRGEGASVLLIDDVWTTGSTAAAAAEVLKAGGFSKVFVLTLAHGSV